MDFVGGRVYLSRMSAVPMHVLTLVSHKQHHPAEKYEKDRDVTIVDEKTGLTCPLEPPVHGVSAEQGARCLVRILALQLLGIPDLILNCRRYEPFGLVADLLVSGSIEEDKDSPKPHSLVQVLRLYLV